MNPPSSNLITPGKTHSIDDSKSTVKSQKSQKSQKSRKSRYSNSSHKSHITSSIYSSSTGKPHHISTGEDIFPDYGVNWGSKNKLGWSKKEMNFTRNSSPKPLMIPSEDSLMNCTENDIESNTPDMKSEAEESKYENSRYLEDIQESKLTSFWCFFLFFQFSFLIRG